MKSNVNGTVGDAHAWESMQPFQLVTAYATCVAQLSHVESCPTCAKFTAGHMASMVVCLKENIARAEAELADRGYSWFSIYMINRVMRQAGSFRNGQKKLPFPFQMQFVAEITRDDGASLLSSRFSNN